MAKYQEWLDPDGLLKLEGWARDGLTNEQIAKNIGINVCTLYDWQNKHADISNALKKGKEVVDREVENALLKRALGYSYKEVVRERIADTRQKERHRGGIELTEKQWEIAKSYFNNECCYCGKAGKMTKDHMKPLNAGGELTMTNIIPCCQSCNSSKKDHEIMSWYQEQPFYNKDRAKKIFDYIHFAESMVKLMGEDEENNELVVTKEIEKTVLPDTTAQIFWLKNRKPNEWRDKVENVSKPDREINININSTKNLKDN